MASWQSMHQLLAGNAAMHSHLKPNPVVNPVGCKYACKQPCRTCLTQSLHNQGICHAVAPKPAGIQSAGWHLYLTHADALSLQQTRTQQTSHSLHAQAQAQAQNAPFRGRGCHTCSAPSDHCTPRPGRWYNAYKHLVLLTNKLIPHTINNFTVDQHAGSKMDSNRHCTVWIQMCGRATHRAP